jgi:hypothetical protein
MTDPTENPFQPGDTVTVTVHDWHQGELRLSGRVTRILSPARCQVEIDGKRYSALVDDIELGCAETLAKARAA